MAEQKKIIAVVGATGAQGGGLARAILADRESPFAVRALTRNPDSPKARALADQGAEVVAVDLHDADSVKRGFSGAYGAYCVTFFWEHFSPDQEIAEAKNMAEAARATGLEHVVWSTLEDVRLSVPLEDTRMPTLLGRFKVPHFDAKGESDAFFGGLPVTYLLASFYWDNLIQLAAPRKGDDGVYSLVLPMADAPLAGIGAEDIGRTAYGILKKGAELVGQRIGAAGGQPTGVEMAASMTRVLGKPIRYVSPTFDQYRGFGFPGADELGNMFQFYVEFGEAVNAMRDVNRTRSLNPDLLDFAGWLEANKSKFAL